MRVQSRKSKQEERIMSISSIICFFVLYLQSIMCSDQDARRCCCCCFAEKREKRKEEEERSGISRSIHSHSHVTVSVCVCMSRMQIMRVVHMNRCARVSVSQAKKQRTFKTNTHKEPAVMPLAFVRRHCSLSLFSHLACLTSLAHADA